MLTRRAREFLAQVKQLEGRGGGPVHYSGVALALGVSKWTAYDMLKRLERDGYLAGEYLLQNHSLERSQGRSLIVFSLTLRGEEALAQAAPGPADDWAVLREQLLGDLDSLRRVGLPRALRQVRAELARVQKPIAFCGYIIALLLLCSRVLDGQALEFARRILGATPEPGVALSVFAGSLGGMVYRAAGRLGLRRLLPGYLSHYQRRLAEVGNKGQRLLLEFLREALDRE